MEYFYFDSLVSTSTKVQEILSQRKLDNTSFDQALVVQAGSQTGGRGRRGHGWESPEGNLYLTLALPQHSSVDPLNKSPSVGLIPLKVAVLIARWIDQVFGIRVTVKWPNDLYIYGSKLGGVLVESSVSREGDSVRWGPLLVGIGINLNLVPQEHKGAARLWVFTGQQQDPRRLGPSLAAFIVDSWSTFPLSQVREQASPWSLAKGHPWVCQKTGDLWLQDPIGPLGTLGLHRPEADSVPGKTLELASSHHDMRWAYTRKDQRPDPSINTPLLIADVGNSRLKVGFFADYLDPKPQQVANLGGADEDVFIEQFKDRLGLPWGWPLHILSVNPKAADLLCKTIESLGLTPVMVKKRPTILRQNPKNPYDFGTLGIDRIAAMEGFLAGLNPDQRALNPLGIVISAGTATTVDFVTARGEHQGGVILPGIDLSLRTLHQETGLLPLAPGEVAEVGLGTTTTSALSQGVIAMTLGAVSELYQRVFSQDPANRGLKHCLVTITGGMGQSLAPHLEGGVVDQDLILSGGRYLVLGGG